MDSFGRFVSDNWDDLYRLAYLLAGKSLDADDLLQDALVKAMRSWPRIEMASSRMAYLRKILATTAIDSGRNAQRRTILTLQAHRAGDDDSGTWENALIDRSHLWPLIAALPPRQRAIVVLRYYEGLSERQIAATLGCRPGTVKSQASAAIGRLAAQVQGAEEGSR